MTEKHLTTICGPQAEAILEWIKGGNGGDFKDKSVPGLTVVELWEL